MAEDIKDTAERLITIVNEIKKTIKRVKFEGPSPLDPLWVEVTENNGLTWHTFTTNLKSCSHNWVTTIGFSSQYTDCSICGIKKEDLNDIS